MQLKKAAWESPSSSALWFILWTKASSEPAILSARHRAHSLLEGRRVPNRRSCTVICHPASMGITPSLDSDSSCAAGETVTHSSREICPAERASMVSRQVISLEVLAMAQGASA